MSVHDTKYPAKSAGTCIICEDVRAEISGKLMMIGIYPGETVRFQKKPTKESPGIVNLALSFWFRGARGTFDTLIAVYNPDEELIVESKVGEQVVEAGKVLSFVVGVQRAQFVTDGKHRIVLSLNEREYEFPLFITYAEESD